MFLSSNLLLGSGDIGTVFLVSVIGLSAMALLLAFLLSGVWRANYVLEYTTTDGETRRLTGNSFTVYYRQGMNNGKMERMTVGQSVANVYLFAQTYTPSTIGGLNEVHLRDVLVTRAELRY